MTWAGWAGWDRPGLAGLTELVGRSQGLVSAVSQDTRCQGRG